MELTGIFFIELEDPILYFIFNLWTKFFNEFIVLVGNDRTVYIGRKYSSFECPLIKKFVYKNQWMCSDSISIFRNPIQRELFAKQFFLQQYTLQHTFPSIFSDIAVSPYNTPDHLLVDVFLFRHMLDSLSGSKNDNQPVGSSKLLKTTCWCALVLPSKCCAHIPFDNFYRFDNNILLFANFVYCCICIGKNSKWLSVCESPSQSKQNRSCLVYRGAQKCRNDEFLWEIELYVELSRKPQTDCERVGNAYRCIMVVKRCFLFSIFYF